MGHTDSVHEKFYKLPQEAIHLTAMSRILLAVSTKEIELIRGKALDELPTPQSEDTVEFLMPVNEVNEDTEEKEQNGKKRKSQESEDQIPLEIEEPPKKQPAFITMGTKTVTAPRPWSTEEKEAVLRHLSSCITEKRLKEKS